MLPPGTSAGCVFIAGALAAAACYAGAGEKPGSACRIRRLRGDSWSVALPADHPAGPASIREHAIAWHPERCRFYLLADVVPLSNPHHPNTYGTGLHLWSSPDLAHWRYIGVAAPAGAPGAYAAHGAASAAGMVFFRGRLVAPFSARRTASYTGRSIGLAWSGPDPENLPWSTTPGPVSDTDGEDDDAAVVVMPGDECLHLYHRTTSGGYHIVHTASASPFDPGSWPRAQPVVRPPPGVRSQELTGACVIEGVIHLFVIEMGPAVRGIRIAHLISERATGPFAPAWDGRYLDDQPDGLAYGGHFTPVVRGERLVAASWTVFQEGPRYGILGCAVRLESVASRP